LKLLENRKHYKTKRNMEQAQKLSELIDEFKEKISDKEYKDTLEAVGELMNVKRKETYVKVIRIKSHTTIYTETVKDDDEQNETYIHNIRDNFRYEMCSNDCDCGECSREPLRTVEIKNQLKEETMWMKVCDDREFWESNDVIGRRYFDILKKSKTLSMANGDILVYLDDNE
jgi:hypothetical protein